MELWEQCSQLFVYDAKNYVKPINSGHLLLTTFITFLLKSRDFHFYQKGKGN